MRWGLVALLVTLTLIAFSIGIIGLLSQSMPLTEASNTPTTQASTPAAVNTVGSQMTTTSVPTVVSAPEPPKPTSVKRPTDAVALAPTAQPTPALAVASSTAIALEAIIEASTTSVNENVQNASAATSWGTLVVKGRVGCTNRFFQSFAVGDALGNILGGGPVGSYPEGSESFIPSGTYVITLTPHIGSPIARQSVVVREGETTTVDFAPDLSTLLLSEDARLKTAVGFGVMQADIVAQGISPLAIGEIYCASPGEYTVVVSPGYPKFPGNGGERFGVRVTADEEIVVGPETWAQGVGVLSTGKAYDLLRFRVTNMQTGEEIEDNYLFPRWVPVGKYSLESRGSPYIGFKIIVEVKPREETVIPLPK